MNTKLINEFLTFGNSHKLTVVSNALGTTYTAQLTWDGQIFQTAQGKTLVAALEALEAVMAALDRG